MIHFMHISYCDNCHRCVRMYLLHWDHYVPQSDVHSYKWTLFNLLNTLTVMKGYGNFNKTFQLAFQITWYPGRFLSGTCFSNTFLMAWGHSVWVIYISSLMNTNILCILGCISTKMWPFNLAAMFVNTSLGGSLSSNKRYCASVEKNIIDIFSFNWAQEI